MWESTLTDNDLAKGHDIGWQVDAIILDFSKALVTKISTIHQLLLLSWSTSMTCQSVSHQWSTRVCHIYSSWFTSMICQSVSHLLFLDHINDLPECVTSTLLGSHQWPARVCHINDLPECHINDRPEFVTSTRLGLHQWSTRVCHIYSSWFTLMIYQSVSHYINDLPECVTLHQWSTRMYYIHSSWFTSMTYQSVSHLLLTNSLMTASIQSHQ